MRVRLRLWLQLATATIASSSSDFLQSTLNKIQKERLETMLVDSTQVDNNTDYNGEIVFGANDNYPDSPSDDNFELTFTNNLDIQEHEEISDHHKPVEHNTHSEDSNGNPEEEIQGYYYYFYPLNNYVHNTTHNHEPTSINESEMMNMVMDSMTKNNMMKAETKVTLLFKAMTWFIGTAMIFVVTILLLPKFRVKKAKKILEERKFNYQFTQGLPHNLNDIFTFPKTLHVKK